MAAAKHKLKLSKLTFLSLVDTPAQEPATVRLIKRAVQGDEIEVKATARIVKVGPGDDPLIYAWAFQCVGDDGGDYSDLQGDTITPDFVKAAEEFMSAGGAVDTQHNEKQSSRVAFAFPMDSDIASSMFGAPGAAIKTVGLMTAIRASSDDLRRVRAGELNGVSIMGTGIREAVKSAAVDPCNTCGGPALKSAPACPSCGAYGKADAATCTKCGKAMKRRPAPTPAQKAMLSTADKDSLSDNAFLYVEDGGKLVDGKTEPRSLRHFPYRTSTGAIDVAHLRAACSDIPKSGLPGDLRDKLQVRAEKLLAAQHDKAAKRALRKQAVLTSTVDGHQHQIDLDDPSDEWQSDQLTTSYNTSEGADGSHCHAWVYDDTTGAITVAEDSGHTHAIDAVVPADVIAQAARNEAGERCPKCGEMQDDGCRYCSCCGAAMDRRDGVPSAAASEDDSASGPTVVVVTARAPRRISPPSGVAPTVKSETKESTAMADQNDTIRALQSENALLKGMATLTDAQRAHYTKLVSKGVKSDADGFLALTPAQRNTALAEIAKADAEVYVSKSTGRVYRQSDAIEIIEAAKQTDAMADVMKRLESERAELDFSKRGAVTLASFSKGAKGNLQGRIMKALAAEFTDVGEYAEVERAMKSANHALKELETAKGVNPHRDAGDEPTTAQAKLDALAGEYAKKNNVTITKASVAILDTVEGAALYAQLPTGRA